MNPSQIPILATTPNTAGVKPLTAQAQALQSEIFQGLADSAYGIESLLKSVASDIYHTKESVSEKMGTVFNPKIEAAIKQGKKVDKLVGKLITSVEVEARNKLDSTRELLKQAGAKPRVLLEDMAAENETQNHYTAALESLVIPMIESQRFSAPVNQTCDPERTDQPWCPKPTGDDGHGRDFPPGYPGVPHFPSEPGSYPRLPEPRPDPMPTPKPPVGTTDWPYPDDCMDPDGDCTDPPPVPPVPAPCPSSPPPPPACPAPIINVSCGTCGSTQPTPGYPPPSPPTMPPRPPEPKPNPPYPPEPPRPRDKPDPPVPPVPPTPPTRPGDIPLPPKDEPLPPERSPRSTLSAQPSFIWDEADPCAVNDAYMKVAPPPVEDPTTGEAQTALTGAISNLWDWITTDTTLKSVITADVMHTLRDFGVRLTDQVINTVAGNTYINTNALIASGTLVSLAGWAETLSRAPVSRIAQNALYEFQSQTAFELPSQDSIDGIYVNGAISKYQWECYTKALGHGPNTHWMALQAKLTRPGVSENVSLRLRNLITQQQYYDEQRRNGVENNRDADAFLRIASYIPGPSDLVRYMTRDVMNPAVVAAGQFDDGFDTNFSGDIAYWAAAQGVTPDVMKADWRAHWTMPSNTDIYEFIRRLRPGRVAAGLEFTKEDAVELLKVNDHAPGYIDRLVEISYHPINRTDVEAAYISGAMPVSEVYERYLDLGYSPTDAKQLQDASTIKKRNQTQQSAGIWTKRKINREYIGGGLSRFDAEELLSKVIPDAEQLKELLDSADLLRKTQSKNKCIAGAKRQYFTGFYTWAEARVTLLDLGVDLLQANTLLDGWRCERDNRAKEPTVKMLGQWTEYGILTVAQMLQRLVNLGYSIDDGKRIVIALNIELKIKAIAKAKAEAKEQAAEKRRQDADKRRQDKERKGK